MYEYFNIILTYFSLKFFLIKTCLTHCVQHEKYKKLLNNYPPYYRPSMYKFRKGGLGYTVLEHT